MRDALSRGRDPEGPESQAQHGAQDGNICLQEATDGNAHPGAAVMGPGSALGRLFLGRGIIFVDKKFCSPVSMNSRISNDRCLREAGRRFSSLRKLTRAGGPEAAGMRIKAEKRCVWQ